MTRAHRDHVTAWWAEVMGGPPADTEQHGGYARMLAHHRDLAITPEQRLRHPATSLPGNRAGQEPAYVPKLQALPSGSRTLKPREP